MSNLAEYLRDNLFKTFADNRKVLEPAWERNKDAYEMTGDRVSQGIGVGKAAMEWAVGALDGCRNMKTKQR